MKELHMNLKKNVEMQNKLNRNYLIYQKGNKKKEKTYDF